MKWHTTNQKQSSALGRYITMMMCAKHLGKVINCGCYWQNFKHIDRTNMFDEGEYFNSVETLKSKIIDRGDWDKFVSECDAHGNKFIQAIKKISEQNLKELSNSQLKDFFSEFLDLYMVMWAFIANGFVLIDGLSREIEEKLGKISNDIKKDFFVLTKVTQENHITVLQKRLLEVAKKIFANAKSKLLFENDVQQIIDSLSEDILAEIKKIYEEYQWMGMMFLLGKPHTLEDFVERIKLMVEKDPNKTLEKIEIDRKETEEKFKELIKELKIEGRLLKLIEALKKAGHNRTEELQYLCKGEFLSLPLLTEIGRRMGLNFQELTCLTVPEVLDFLETGKLVDKALIEERKEEFGMIMLDGKIEVFSGDVLAKIKGEAKDYSQIKEIKGSMASAGKAQGTVKIVIDASQIHKVEKGDVLVAIMTTPDFVMAMEKAVAIVTNDGGITCHAAIISRELGIPCVVGTKIATKVLNDGEMVEVDATTGMVKRLK